MTASAVVCCGTSNDHTVLDDGNDHTVLDDGNDHTVLDDGHLSLIHI